MLDRINNDGLDLINQGQGLEKVSLNGVSNPYKREDYKYFLIDESDISPAAFEKYQREHDIKKFSAILKETDENEANSLVMQSIFKGKFSIEDAEIYNSIINNNDFLNDVFKSD